MIGAIAACLTTFGSVPQAIKVIKTKNTTGISLWMYVMNVIGIFLWAIHGFMIKDMAVLGANSSTLILSSIILAYKIKYR